MEHETFIRQHDQFVQLARELVSASEALATRMAGDEGAITFPTAYELLTNLMDTLMAVSRATQGLRVRLVASLYTTTIGLNHVYLATGETHDHEESVLAADADILLSATTLELAEMSLSRARNVIAAQVHDHANRNPDTTARSPL